MKEFIHNLPDHQPQDIKPEWEHAPVLEFSDGPFVVMMCEKRDKDPSDSKQEYTRNHFSILRIENGQIQEVWN